MNPQQLYHKQYAEHALIINHESFFKKTFHKFNVHRRNVAISLLERGNNLLDIGCGEGSLLLKARNKY